jgi:retron-type reverse transcriptase
MDLKSLLSSAFMLDDETIYRFAVTCPHRYKVYSIQKRNGKGLRTIAHPSKELKVFQRQIAYYLGGLFQEHEATFAYRKGVGIKDNAELHSGSEYILKMDFKNFFPSITPDLFFSQVRELGIPLPQRDKALMRHFLFYKRSREDSLRLSIGAPSSPIVSNICMHRFDEKIAALTVDSHITYSRYADDLTFSTIEKETLFVIPELVKATLESVYGQQIQINTDKTIFSSKAHQRFVTGVTLTNQGGISIGRKRKRKIMAMVHHFCNNRLDQDEIEKLRGLIAFAKHIEPSLLMRIDNKYGKGVSKMLLSWRSV